MIADFPAEIVSHVANGLSQIDVVSLSCTCKLLYSVVQPRLYASVSIDSSKYHYLDDFSLEEETNETSTVCIPSVFYTNSGLCHTNSRVNPVTIKSLYSLKLFLKNLLAFPEYCSFIQVLNVHNKIPDICEYELMETLKTAFQHFTNLKVLNWFSIEIYLPISIINLLPNKEMLLRLNGNFKNLTENVLGVSGHLRELNLSAFNQAANLQTVDLDNSPRLTKLLLSKHSSSDNSLIKNETTPELRTCLIPNLIEANPGDDLCDLKVSYLAPIFRSKKVFNLTVLGLSGISVSYQDAELLTKKLNLMSLEQLSIDNCTEAFFDNSRSIRVTPPETSFLDILAAKLTGLKVINIGIQNDVFHNEKLFHFFKTIPSSLKQIKVLLKVSLHDNLTHQLASLVSSLEDHSPTLKYLNLDYEIMSNSGTAPVKPATCSIKAFNGVKKMTNLHYLKLPINLEHIHETCKVLQPLPRLQFLQLLLADDCKSSDTPPPLISTSLISQDYFCYPNDLVCGLQSQQSARLQQYCSQFQAVSGRLQYVSFQSKGDRNMNDYNFVFSRETSSNFILRDNNLLNHMDRLVEDCIR